MTSLKQIPHIFSHKNNNDPKQRTNFTFENFLSSAQKINLAQDHKSLIEEIKSKNNLLTKTQIIKNPQNSKNLPTQCQKYANVLFKKYGLQRQINFQTRKVKQTSVKYLTREQQFNRNIFLAKQYLHASQHDFDQSTGDLLIRLKQVSNFLSAKFRSLKQNDKLVEQQLIILEIFSKKLTHKITNLLLNPFFILHKENKVHTPLRTQNPEPKINKKQKFQVNNTSNVEKKVMESNLLTDNSPNLLTDNSPNLVSVFQEKQEQSNLLMSFKPNFQSSQNCFSTLKYSDSELLLNFSKNQQKESNKQVIKQEDNPSLAFSPVQPYRLHKLKTESEKQKIDSIVEKYEFVLRNDDHYLALVTEQAIGNIKKCTKKQYAQTKSMMSIYSQSVNEISRTLQITHTTLIEQKKLAEEEWSEMSLILDKDIQEMSNFLQLERVENEIKDKRFLQNVDMIQNQLIEQIFAQKQERKNNEEVLAEILKNFIQSVNTQNQ